MESGDSICGPRFLIEIEEAGIKGGYHDGIDFLSKSIYS
jgi:hypothetical protein